MVGVVEVDDCDAYLTQTVRCKVYEMNQHQGLISRTAFNFVDSVAHSAHCEDYDQVGEQEESYPTRSCKFVLLKCHVCLEINQL